MYKKFAIIAAFALLTAAGAQAQVVNCNLTLANGVCVVSGLLDAEGFTVSILGLDAGAGIYSMETIPWSLGVAVDSKITSTAGALMADDEHGKGYDRYVCTPGSCPTAVKVVPFSVPTNKPIRFMISKVNN